MNEEERRKIISGDYADGIVEYAISSEEFARYAGETINYINDKYAVIYAPRIRVPDRLIGSVAYSVIPKLYSLLDTSSLEQMGVIKLQRIPYLSLQGNGVLLGFIDTGIDYTNPLFQYGDKTTRIVSLWDQTIENMQASPDIFYYGTEYSREQINLALRNENPFDIVPSTDDLGHGTTLAGLAGGMPNESREFSGVAPLSEYVIVKLKRAKADLKNYFGVPDDAICYAESDIMFGLAYLVNTARKMNRPIAICIGLGSNQGSHEGLGPLNDLISTYSNQAGIAIVIAAGNEGNARHHFYGEINNAIGYTLVELKVGADQGDFSMELWGNIPGTYSIDIISPSGEYISRIPAKIGEFRNISFIFELTTIYVDYVIVEAQTGDELILIRFRNPAPGIWKFRVYGSKITSGFHIWLPVRGFISEETVFLFPNQYTTITEPGNNVYAITATAYNPKDQSLYINASRGYTRYDIISPDLAAPGVDIYSPLPDGKYGSASGTSTAAALITGVTAMVLEWGIVNGNDRSMDTYQIKKYLIRGVSRNPSLKYPNREWGYGMVNIYGTFESLSGE
ncbi:subtilase family protein [Mobilisporobacter senegalensis]|uniref:Subtilase family protein n=1 Tax=Mobilisporobacter senegalensis TaxID=1329262 RepID=A0A3N1XZ42_9FIRM|nr:S8 family peptidase [Mobilisporobacter senegalensis]ROR30522.1 subtilase family protein [Mobilisporobacter senegalensis]